jgi:hypothetical protein
MPAFAASPLSLTCVFVQILRSPSPLEQKHRNDKAATDKRSFITDLR